MGSEIVVVLPVLDRPHRVEPVLASLRSAQRHVAYRPLFVVSPHDQATAREADRCGADVIVTTWAPGMGDWARKLNLALRETTEPWLFTGADDLCFCPGWADEAVRVGAPSRAGVVGTNDLGNGRVIAGNHSTHSLVARWYAEQYGTIDEPGKMFHEGYQHNYCTPPDAPVWMSDLRFRPIGDVNVGDEVVGWEHFRARKMTLKRLRTSRVKATGRRAAPLVRVVMASGREFRCTPDHNWFNAAWSPSSKHDRQWVTPRVGRTLLHVADPDVAVRSGHERLAGWLAGIYDGEGSGQYVATQSLKNIEVIERVEYALATLDIPYRRTDRPTGIAEFWLRGGKRGYLSFLIKIDPVKRDRLVHLVLNGRATDDRVDGDGSRRFGQRDRVVALEPAGRGEVVSLTTTTGNYVAWGYASKNCDDELVHTARARGAFVFARNAMVEHLHPDWGKGAWDDTYRLGKSGMQSDAAYFQSRRPLWETHRQPQAVPA